MTKSELSLALAEKIGIKKKDARLVTDEIFELMRSALVRGEKVQISGFGSFEVKDRPARIGHNPSTHEEIQIPAYKSASFSPGKTLKGAINKKG
ncbi:MAG: HU family DNA-binding protein [Ruminococcaceae bacterium]|nr:HU family DNA-binding protein [Oscillospiraceae bacterium]